MAGILIGLVIGLPWLGAIVLVLTKDENPRLQHRLAVGFSIAAGIASLILIPFSSAETAISFPMGRYFGNLTFTADGLAVSLAAVACVIGSLAVIFSVDYMQGEAGLGRYYAFVLLFISAMSGLVLSSNLLFMFFFWEITALCSYALISFHNDDPKAVAGGIKALIITQVGGVGLLAGALTTYATLGSYQLADLISDPGKMPAGLLALVAYGFLIAAAAKSAQFPFHTWLPDAMEAPTPVSALIHAATMVNAGVYLLARFYPAFEGIAGWRLAVTLTGLTSALLNAFMALTPLDLKRALAYSTVSQLGYMFYAIGVGDVFASQFHLLSHAVFKALLFLAAGAVIHAAGTRDMLRMGALGRQMPVTRNVFILGALALTGIPILNGFWSKELILETGLTRGPLWAYVGMLLGAGMTAFYTFRITWLVFFGEAREALTVRDAGKAMQVSLRLLAAGTLTTWLLVGPFSEMLHGTLPFHSIQTLNLTEMVSKILTAPATTMALGVVALGLASFWMARRRAAGQPAAWAVALSRESFGFDWLNRQVVTATDSLASTLQKTQTGILSWNVVAIIGVLLAVLIFLVWRA
jgi:NADH-quinone oxidoreductase subunit L